LYGFRGKEKVLLASKSFCCYFFSETSARREVEQMVVDLLTAQLKLMGHAISNDVICSEASKLVSAVMENNPSRLLHA
jgi:hypothetical protein